MLSISKYLRLQAGVFLRADTHFKCRVPFTASSLIYSFKPVLKYFNHVQHFFIYFFYWRIIVLQILLFFVKPQHEAAIGIHISPLFWTSLPSPSPSHPSSWYRGPVWVFWAIRQIPLAVYSTYGYVSFHVTLSIHLTLSSPLPMSISLFSMSVSPLLPLNKFFSTIFLDSIYMC